MDEKKENEWGWGRGAEGHHWGWDEVKEREREDGGWELTRRGVSLDGSNWCCIWIHSSFLWFPLCLSAQLVRPSNNKTTSSDSGCGTFTPVLRVTLKIQWPAFGQEKAANGPPCQQSTGNTPQHGSHCPGTATQRNGRGDAGLLGCQCPDTWTQTTQSNINLYPVLDSSCHPHLCGREAGRRSAWVSIAYSHGYSTHVLHTHRQACGLSARLFVWSLVCLSQPSVWLCFIVCGCENRSDNAEDLINWFCTILL